MTKKKRRSRIRIQQTEKSLCPVDTHIDEKIERHGDEAKVRKIREEQARLGPRRRIAKEIYRIIRRELKGKEPNGVHLNDVSLAALSDDISKSICKRTGLENGPKKD